MNSPSQGPPNFSNPDATAAVCLFWAGTPDDGDRVRKPAPLPPCVLEALRNMADADAKEWRPDYPCAYAPVFEPSKWSAKNFTAYFFGFPGWFAPWNLVYAAVTAVSHAYTTPPLDACREFSLSWMAPLFLRNQILLWIFAGGWHALLYWPFRANGLHKKYDRKWPAAGGM